MPGMKGVLRVIYTDGMALFAEDTTAISPDGTLFAGFCFKEKGWSAVLRTYSILADGKAKLLGELDLEDRIQLVAISSLDSETGYFFAYSSAYFHHAVDGSRNASKIAWARVAKGNETKDLKSQNRKTESYFVKGTKVSAISVNCKQYVVVGCEDGVVQVLSPGPSPSRWDDTHWLSQHPGGGVTCVACSACGKYFASGGYDRKVWVNSFPFVKIFGFYCGPGVPYCLCFSRAPDAPALAVGVNSEEQQSVFVWPSAECQSKEELRKFNCTGHGRITSIDFSHIEDLVVGFRQRTDFTICLIKRNAFGVDDGGGPVSRYISIEKCSYPARPFFAQTGKGTSLLVCFEKRDGGQFCESVKEKATPPSKGLVASVPGSAGGSPGSAVEVVDAGDKRRQLGQKRVTDKGKGKASGPGDGGDGAISSCARDPSSQPKIKVVVLCVKYHEYECFMKFLKAVEEEESDGGKANLFEKPSVDKRGSNPNMCTDSVGVANEPGYVSEVHSYGTFDLVLASFGRCQGPLETAIRVSRLIDAETTKSNDEEVESHLYIGMVGVCAGETLGEVIVAMNACSVEGDRVDWIVEQSSGESSDHSTASGTGLRADLIAKEYVEASFPHGRKESPRYAFMTHRQSHECGKCCSRKVMEDFRNEYREGIHGEFDRSAVSSVFSHTGTLFSYSHVRNDCELELRWIRNNFAAVQSKIGIDMEAMAFFQTVAFKGKCLGCNVHALPVIKGVSDVGREVLLLDEELVQGKLFERRKGNREEFEKVTGKRPEKFLTGKERRIAYRPAAAKAAANMMVDFLKLWVAYLLNQREYAHR